MPVPGPLIAVHDYLEQRFEDRGRHGDGVAEYCAMIAAELGLPEETAAKLTIAGDLRDIGKVAVDPAILSKPGPLDELERIEVRRHVEIGASLLVGAGLDEIGAWVLAHHERPDGSGYPNGLRGEEIPLPARILAVADAFDAMLSERSYRPALSREMAEGELRRRSGREFDAEVVAALMRALERAPAVPGATGNGAAASNGAASNGAAVRVG